MALWDCFEYIIAFIVAGRGRNRGKLRTNAYRIEKRVKGGSQEKGEPEPRVQGTGSGRFGPCEKGSE